MFEFYLGKTDRDTESKKAKMISDPFEIYRSLATTWTEVVNLLFNIDSFVWVSRKYTEEQQVPNLRHKNDVVGA